jgi:hypothetical protein
LDADLERGFTTHGPHRDELAFTREGRLLRSYGSQGQQRLALLALLLAERDAIAAVRGAPPLMLLDDVMSELDAGRRAQLVALLRDDAVMTMPPAPLLYRGSRVIGDFFATVPMQGALDRTRLLTTRANGQPAVAVYFPDDESGGHQAYGLMVLVLDGDRIAEIVGFADPSLFPVFGLPAELPDQARPATRR